MSLGGEEERRSLREGERGLPDSDSGDSSGERGERGERTQRLSDSLTQSLRETFNVGGDFAATFVRRRSEREKRRLTD